MSAQRELGDFVPPAAGDSDRDDLAAIFENITGDATFTESQVETPSHEPIEGESDAPDLSADGLDDAADSDLQMGGWI